MEPLVNALNIVHPYYWKMHLCTSMRTSSFISTNTLNAYSLAPRNLVVARRQSAGLYAISPFVSIIYGFNSRWRGSHHVRWSWSPRQMGFCLLGRRSAESHTDGAAPHAGAVGAVQGQVGTFLVHILHVGQAFRIAVSTEKKNCFLYKKVKQIQEKYCKSSGKMHCRIVSTQTKQKLDVIK